MFLKHRIHTCRCADIYVHAFGCGFSYIASVILTGRRKANIEEAAGEIASMGGKAVAIQADASLEQQINMLIDTVTREYGRIDILINNAEVFETGQVIDTTLESWNYQLTNNQTSPS